nr:hypothetical protein [uncultured Holophaga sp.]
MKILRPALISLLAASAAHPCGPYLSTTALVPTDSPDGRPEDWARGALGLLMPSYASPYLAMAFRSWGGPPLDAEDQAGALGYWQEPGQSPAPDYARLHDGILPTPPPELLAKASPTYQLANPVMPQAMDYAARTLEQRIKAIGPKHPAIRAWVEAQDKAFRGELPPDPEPGLPVLLAKDRAYQRAAALYYAGKASESRQAFLAIGQDKASPHAGLARYLALRLAEGPDRERELAVLLKDPLWRLDAYRLQEQVEPPWKDLSECQRMTAERIMSPGRGFRLGEDLRNLSFTYRAGVDVLAKAEGPQDLGLLGWIQALRDGKPDRVIAGFDAVQGAAQVPWLAGVLMKIGPDHPRCREFLEKARTLKIPEGAYPTFAVHRVRLLLGEGRLQAAEVLVKEALARPGMARFVSARNVLLGQRLVLTRDWDSFVGLLGRTVTGMDEEGLGSCEGKQWPQGRQPGIDAFDPAAADAFNRQLPLERWKAALVHPAFPSSLKGQLQQVLFVRAILLDREADALALVDGLAKTEPKDAAGLEAWRAEPDARRRRFLVSQFLWERQWVSFLKQSPEDMYEYRTTWWGPVQPLPGLAMVGKPFVAGFLSSAEVQAAQGENRRLAAPLSYFCREALAFAEAFPKDPMAAEGLSRAVRASRAAYRDPESEALLVKAFRLLHKRYAGSAAANRAKVYH